MSTVLRNTDQPAPRGAGPTIPALLLRNAREHGDLPALSWRAADGAEWTTLTWAEVRDRVARLAAGYARLGVARGDHVLLMMGNRPEHWLTDLALVHLGAVPVTVYGTSAPDQVAYLARHSRARLAVVEGAAELARFEPLLDGGGTRLERLVVVDETAVGGHTPYRQPGPIFVHAEPCAYEPAADVPDQLARRLLSVRSFGEDHLMRGGVVVHGAELEATADRLLADEAVSYLHVHNAGPGCFAARIDRLDTGR